MQIRCFYFLAEYSGRLSIRTVPSCTSLGGYPRTLLGSLTPPRFAKGAMRRRQGGFLQLPCLLGFLLAFPPLGPPLRLPNAAAPLRYGPHQRQKGNGKARPHDLWGLAHKTLAERGTATAPSPRQSRCPCPTGSGGFIRPAAGYRLQTTSPRCCATPAARVGPPCT